MMQFKNNIADIAKALASGSDKAIIAMQQGLRNGVREFESKMIKEQFSGRPGLKRKSGTAANSWYMKEHGTGLEYSITLMNRPVAWYIAVHQHYNFDGHISVKRAKVLSDGKRVYIPKRLNIFEDFNKSAPALILKNIIRQIDRKGV